jgi:flagellar motor switch protein FliN
MEELTVLPPMLAVEPFRNVRWYRNGRASNLGDESSPEPATGFDVEIELGRALLPMEEVSKLREGSVVSLEKFVADPVDIFVDGVLVARGEVLVLNNRLGVRIAEILLAQPADSTFP